MSIRHIWILSYSFDVKDDGRPVGNVLFSKPFPTCERRAKLYGGDRYVAVPDDQGFYDGLITELGWRNQSDDFVESRDTCRRYEHKPVLTLTTKAGLLWPVIVLEQHNLLFCCLPLVVTSGGADNRPALVSVPSVAVGFNFLLCLAEYIGPQTAVSDELMLNLHLFVNQSAPFGTPLDTNPTSITQLQHARPLSHLPNTKQPAWRPVPHKGKSYLHFTITEYIRAVQYDNPNNPDFKELYGTITCRAVLDGYSHDVTINVTHQADSALYIPLDNLILHSSIQSSDTQQPSTKGGAVSSRRTSTASTMGVHKIRFCPSLDSSMPLCHYSMRLDSSMKLGRENQLPITAFYQMKSTHDSADLLIQLKLNPAIRNAFDFVEVQLPFVTRGTVASFEHTCNHGNVSLTANRHTVVWSVGNKFPTKTLEALMKASLKFNDNLEPATTMSTDDAFSVGNNAYARVFFKMSDFTYSGVTIDQKSIMVVPTTKYKLNLVRELVATEYKVWNSHGDALIAFPPPARPAAANVKTSPVIDT